MAYKTKHPVRHNGTLYLANSMIELEEKTASVLLDCGAIKAVDKPPQADTGNKKKTSDNAGKKGK